MLWLQVKQNKLITFSRQCQDRLDVSAACVHGHVPTQEQLLQFQFPFILNDFVYRSCNTNNCGVDRCTASRPEPRSMFSWSVRYDHGRIPLQSIGLQVRK